MRITVEPLPIGEEEEIIIRCNELDDDLLEVLQVLKTRRSKITAYDQNKIVFLLPTDVFYFEAVDNKVFAYCESHVYEIRKKLYELENDQYTDFLRISKSVILNLSKISYLSPSFNGKFDAKLKNDEIIIISRQYVLSLKNKLGI